MRYKLEPDHPLTNESTKLATGKTLNEWYRELDAMDGLKKGRRNVNMHLQSQKLDPWWCTTISVEYERHHNLRKKDGLLEGYFVCSTKTISAPLKTVYQAFGDKAVLNRWFGEVNNLDFREGGVLKTKDGESGTILRVRENKDIRVELNNPGFSAPVLVDAQFQDKGKGKTGLLVNLSRIQERAEADALRNAWAEALTRLKEVCED